MRLVSPSGWPLDPSLTLQGPATVRSHARVTTPQFLTSGHSKRWMLYFHLWRQGFFSGSSRTRCNYTPCIKCYRILVSATKAVVHNYAGVVSSGFDSRSYQFPGFCAAAPTRPPNWTTSCWSPSRLPPATSVGGATTSGVLLADALATVPDDAERVAFVLAEELRAADGTM